MCFESDSNRNVTASGIPIPQRKPSRVADNSGSILGSIFNSAKGVFESIGSIELRKYEAERLADIRAIEEEARIKRQQDLAGNNFPEFTGQEKAIIGSSSVLAILMLGTAAILISKRG